MPKSTILAQFLLLISVSLALDCECASLHPETPNGPASILVDSSYKFVRLLKKSESSGYH